MSLEYKHTTITHGTTGTKTISCGFLPKKLTITVSKKTGVTDNVNHASIGKYGLDSDIQVVNSWADDNIISPLSDRNSTRIVKHYEKNSGAWAVVAEAHVDQSTAPWSLVAPYDIKYIVDVASTSYQYDVEIEG